MIKFLYECDPLRAKECPKTDCAYCLDAKSHRCAMTTRPEWARLGPTGQPVPHRARGVSVRDSCSTQIGANLAIEQETAPRTQFWPRIALACSGVSLLCSVATLLAVMLG